MVEEEDKKKGKKFEFEPGVLVQCQCKPAEQKRLSCITMLWGLPTAGIGFDFGGGYSFLIHGPVFSYSPTSPRKRGSLSCQPKRSTTNRACTAPHPPLVLTSAMLGSWRTLTTQAVSGTLLLGRYECPIMSLRKVLFPDLQSAITVARARVQVSQGQSLFSGATG